MTLLRKLGPSILAAAAPMCALMSCGDDCPTRGPGGSVQITYSVGSEAGGTATTDTFLVFSGGKVSGKECVNRDCSNCCVTDAQGSAAVQQATIADLATLVPVGNPDCVGQQNETLTIIRYDANGATAAQTMLQCQQIDRARMDPARGTAVISVVDALRTMANRIAGHCG